MDDDRQPPPPVRCPECGRAEGILIAFGFPTDETVAAAGRGEVELGGCLFDPEAPDRRCRACGHAWKQPDLPLAGRAALVTGVSRRRGIGYAIVERLGWMGADVFVQHHAAHDAEQPWGADDLDELMEGLDRRMYGGGRFDHASIDLGRRAAAAELVHRAVDALGHLDILICNHARSGHDGTLDQLDPADLDAHWAVNARSTLLLTKEFAAQHDGRDGGRVVWLTSGQQLGPMPDEIAYATSKAALAGITPSVADWLIDRGIVLNTVNPGPVNTGYLDVETTDRPGRLDEIRAHFPTGRFGLPDDPARLVAWLVSDEGRWMVGQVLSTEGGFRRW